MALAQYIAAQAACDAVKVLAVRVGIPQHLSELGIKESDIETLAQQAIADVCFLRHVSCTHKPLCVQDYVN